jgi:hypothetical protein
MNIGDKELNDVVCAAYKMGCDQTREVYQKRIEKLESALWSIAANACCDSRREAALVARKALEESNTSSERVKKTGES